MDKASLARQGAVILLPSPRGMSASPMAPVAPGMGVRRVGAVKAVGWVVFKAEKQVS